MLYMLANLAVDVLMYALGSNMRFCWFPTLWMSYINMSKCWNQSFDAWLKISKKWSVLKYVGIMPDFLNVCKILWNQDMFCCLILGLIHDWSFIHDNLLDGSVALFLIMKLKGAAMDSHSCCSWDLSHHSYQNLSNTLNCPNCSANTPHRTFRMCWNHPKSQFPNRPQRCYLTWPFSNLSHQIDQSSRQMPNWPNSGLDTFHMAFRVCLDPASIQIPSTSPKAHPTWTIFTFKPSFWPISQTAIKLTK